MNPDQTPEYAAEAEYRQQLDTKLDRLQQLLAPLSAPEPQVFRSTMDNYRMRVEFRIWHQGDRCHYAMYRSGTKQTYRINDFPAAAAPIRRLMPHILEYINGSDLLRRRLFSIGFLTTTREEVLVTLIYHKPVDEHWAEAAEALARHLNIQLIGRSRKKKLVIGSDSVTEYLKVDDRIYTMRQQEGTFTQPNARINEAMVAWACDQACACAPDGDMLELYCGNGNFTLPLARHFRKVFATEISKGSITSLKWNLEANQVANVEFARLSAGEASAAVRGERLFRRLQDIDLESYDFSTILVDPPRAGIDPVTMKLVAQFDTIIYISCNPESLAGNLHQLADSHHVEALAAFDQFPCTVHLEAGATLRRRSTQLPPDCPLQRNPVVAL